MRHEYSVPHLLETPQQQLAGLLPEGEDGAELRFVLDRSCTLHCVEAFYELRDSHIPSFDRFEAYLKFLQSNGAHSTLGASNPDFYNVNDGWYNHAIADELLRGDEIAVVLQNLTYDADHTNVEIAAQSHRVTSHTEMEMLETLKHYGGESSVRWFEAIDATLQNVGNVIVSLRVPSSVQLDRFGTHSVMCLEVTNDSVIYFDPDQLNTARYKETADAQEIERVDSDRLIYSQPKALFLARMTGEVMHIFPNTGNS